MARPFGTKKIYSPAYMWELFEAYRKEVKTNPFTIPDWVGKDAIEVNRSKEKPLTLEGFENYCFMQGVISNLQHYFSNLDGKYDSFLSICMRIKRTIRQDQIEGGMAGIYNSSITQRLNGLVDKSDITTNGENINTTTIKWGDKTLPG